MIVLIVTNATPSLRGHLTRWLYEAAPGVYVGNPSARIRDSIWACVQDRIGAGHAVLVRPERCEQRWAADTCGQGRWDCVDFDGATLFRRPSTMTHPNGPLWTVDDGASV